MNTATQTKRPTWAQMVNASQMRVMKSAMRGEEGAYFREKMKTLNDLLSRMPISHETNSQGGEAIAHLHYFRGSCDAWITELDAGCPDDEPGQEQCQAFGLVDLGYGSELGYISIPELLQSGMELDLYWTPKTIAEIKAFENAEEN